MPPEVGEAGAGRAGLRGATTCPWPRCLPAPPPRSPTRGSCCSLNTHPAAERTEASGSAASPQARGSPARVFSGEWCVRRSSLQMLLGRDWRSGQAWGLGWGRIDTRARAAVGALGPLARSPAARAADLPTWVWPQGGVETLHRCVPETASQRLPGCQAAREPRGTAKMGVAETDLVVRSRGLEWGVAWVPIGPSWEVGGRQSGTGSGRARAEAPRPSLGGDTCSPPSHPPPAVLGSDQRPHFADIKLGSAWNPPRPGPSPPPRGPPDPGPCS